MSLGERSIAEEVIRFAEHAMHQNWIGRDRLKISFLGYVQAHRLDRIRSLLDSGVHAVGHNLEDAGLSAPLVA